MPSSTSHCVDVNEATFQKDILEYSMGALVLVDFWATWCEPCKTMGPILEALAREYQGAFRLAKVDVDKNPRLAQGFGAQSVPTVLAVHQGTVVEALVGAQSKAHVKAFIDKALGKCGIEVPKGEPTIPTDPVQALAFWQKRLGDDPADNKARIALGRLLLFEGLEADARVHLEAVETTTPEYHAAQAVLALASLLKKIGEAGGAEAVMAQSQKNPDDTRGQFLLACVEATRGHFAQSVGAVVELIGQPGLQSELRDELKAAASTIFEAAGRDIPEVETQRRRLALLLY